MFQFKIFTKGIPNVEVAKYMFWDTDVLSDRSATASPVMFFMVAFIVLLNQMYLHFILPRNFAPEKYTDLSLVE